MLCYNELKIDLIFLRRTLCKLLIIRKFNKSFFNVFNNKMKIPMPSINEAEFECFEYINYITPILMFIFFIFGIFIFSKKNNKTSKEKNEHNEYTNNQRFNFNNEELFFSSIYYDLNKPNSNIN